MMMEERVTPRDFPEVRWHGHWIWIPEDKIVPSAMFAGSGEAQDETHGLFRKTFELDQAPETVPTRLTADSRYLLYVNGQEVYRGPIRSQPRRLHYDYFDLAPYLRPGKNAIAIYVKYLGRAGSYWMPAVANATLGRTGVLVFEADLGGQWLASDDTWSARRGDAWSTDAYDAEVNQISGGVPTESFDARKQFAGWQSPDFDDGDWGKAQVITPMHIGGRGRSQPPTDPYGPLLPRPIAKLGGERLGAASVSVQSIAEPPDLSANNPAERAVTSALTHASMDPRAASLPVTATVPDGGYTRLVLDMGRIVGGLVTFSVDAPAGTVFDFGYFEEPVVERSMFGAHGGNRYVACGLDDSHIVFDPKGFRYVIMLIHGVSGEVTLNDFAVQEVSLSLAAGRLLRVQRRRSERHLPGEHPHRGAQLVGCVHGLPDA